MSPLAETDRTRLIRLLGMLGSSFDGEIANAGRLAARMVRDMGLERSDVIAPPPHPVTVTFPYADSWRETVRACRPQPRSLSPWEREFLAGLDRFPKLSPKQRAILNETERRVLRQAA